MRYRDVENRIAELEQSDHERQQRVYERVWCQLTPDEQERLSVLVKAEPTRQPSEEELALIHGVDALALADTEGRFCDLIDQSGEVYAEL